MTTYHLIDSGNQKKIEQFGPYRLIRPAQQALWECRNPHFFAHASATFSRTPKVQWEKKSPLPSSWEVNLEGLKMELKLTDFGHVGLFPEHSLHAGWLKQLCLKHKSLRILNLFAYSGWATLFCAKYGAKVTHVDASKGMVAWAKENAKRNHLESHPIRWIVDDVLKFLQREIKRGNQYDGIIIDPPTFGRGKQGQVFKIETHLQQLLEMIRSLLSKQPAFVLFTSHSPGITPEGMALILHQYLGYDLSYIERGEMILPAKQGYSLPSGVYARWPLC